jgi:RNA polymerase primary sigma factor
MFDETKGFKFISYAVWWIRQSIMQALADHSRLVRIPGQQDRRTLEAQPGYLRDRTAVRTGAYPRRTCRVPGHFRGRHQERQHGLHPPVVPRRSLEEGEEGTLLDVLRNNDSTAADTLLENTDSLKIELRRLLSTLSDRESEIICRFFGLGCEYNQSLEDIAEDLGLTRERVRQIKENALKKLRSVNGVSLLQPYLC